MNNVLKKISAALIAISLLSTGAAATKTNFSKTDYTLTAHAEYAHNCTSYKIEVGKTDWHIQGRTKVGLLTWEVVYTRIINYKCAVCDREWAYCDFDTKTVWCWQRTPDTP
jgi:hypothetical protein